MSKQQIRLVSLGVQSFAGIDKSKKAEVEYPVDVTEELKKIDQEDGVVLVFPRDNRFMQSEGDQGVGKTSLTNALLELTGNILVPNAINSIDKDKKLNFQAVGLDGHLYHIRATKSTYVIERIETDENGEPVLTEKGKMMKSEIKAPKDMIKKIIGPAGVSPQHLRLMKPAEQIAWVRGLFTLSVDVLTQEQGIIKKFTEAYKSRTTAGNENKRYKALVEGSELYKDYAANEKLFKEFDFEKEEKEITEVSDRYNQYVRYETGLKQLRESTLVRAENDVIAADNAIINQQQVIADLEKKLALAKETLTRLHDDKQKWVESKIAVETRITEGVKWMEDNKKMKEDYENMATKIKDLTEFKGKKKDWDIMLENKKQMDHFESEYARLTNLVDTYAKEKKKFVNTFSPKVEGLEVCIPDEEDKREGLFYKGRTLDQLAESELWEMATQLWQEFNVQMVFVENINSLGTGAIEKFNEFIKQGGYVFATLMNRAEKNLKITFAHQIN